MDNKPQLTNQQLAGILKCSQIRQASPLPPHLLALDLPSYDAIRELICERLLAVPEPERELTRKEQQELAQGLRKEIRGGTELHTQDFIKGFESYRFTKDFLRGAFTKHKQRTGDSIGCITISLDRFLPPDTLEPVVAVLAGIGAVFNVLSRHRDWPIYTADPHHIFWLINQQVTVEHALPILSGKNVTLVIGHSEHFPDYVPGVNRQELLDLAKEMKSIDRDYPGWILTSDPDEIA